MRIRLLAVALCAVLPLAACDDDGASEGAGGSGGSGGLSTEPDPGNATFQVRESVEQLHVWKAEPGVRLELRDANGETLQLGTTDELGAFVFRDVPPGAGYVLRTVGETPEQHTRPLLVLSAEESLPPKEFYDAQELAPGYGYLTTRDGTKLAIYVTLPGPPELGPYPTVVNYSGYDPAKPGEPVNGGAYENLCPSLPTLCDAPSDASAMIASFMGYATVGVNMRGTGCSGGAYDFFEPLQLLDGYDVIEIVAAQPWVKGHRVGMTGLSYPGISQLFVARSHPPSLAAIAPLSVIGNTSTTMYPGGMLNNGFALLWAENVLDRAGPYAQGWEQARGDAGDGICEENQLLHGQRLDLIAKARETRFYDPAVVDPLNPTFFAPELDVPIFLTGAFQDEQTGPYFTTLLDRFTGSPFVRLTVFNGVHPDGFAPQILVEWKAFLDMFVAEQIPSIDPTLRNLSPLLFQEIFGAQLTMPPDRFGSFATFAEARDAYLAEPQLRVIFENGATAPLGAPHGNWEASFASWPPPSTTPLRLFLQPDGSLGAAAPTEPEAASRFLVDPYAGDRDNMAPHGNIWDPLPAYDWEQQAPGSAVVFESEPLTEDLVMVGTGSVDLWIRSEEREADLQVTLSEVRPDDKESYVQSGWLRASHRKLMAQSTDLWPEPTNLEADYSPLVRGEWTELRVAIAGFGHPFRAGSRIRLAIDTPGGTRSDWRFELARFPAPTWHSVGHSAAHPSSVLLPVVPGLTPPPGLPPCPSLRGQPCRDHVPYVNVAE